MSNISSPPGYNPGVLPSGPTATSAYAPSNLGRDGTVAGGMILRLQSLAGALGPLRDAGTQAQQLMGRMENLIRDVESTRPMTPEIAEKFKQELADILREVESIADNLASPPDADAGFALRAAAQDVSDFVSARISQLLNIPSP